MKVPEHRKFNLMPNIYDNMLDKHYMMWYYICVSCFSPFRKGWEAWLLWFQGGSVPICSLDPQGYSRDIYR